MVFSQLAAQSLAPTACTTIEEVGSTGVGALTIAFLILAVSTIVFIARTGSATTQKKNYYCNVFICGFATMAYFAMLSGQGWTAVAGCRQFFYARYVDMGVTFPLVILNLGLIAGVEGAMIAAVIGAQVISTGSAYLGAVSVVTTVKWFWFVISLAVFTLVIYSIAVSFREAAAAKGRDAADVYGRVAWLIIITWIFYPLVWLFSEGFASFSVSFEVCAYAILDIISKAVFCFMVMGAHDSLGGGATESREFV
jgi:bacteriorhodopsin